MTFTCKLLHICQNRKTLSSSSSAIYTFWKTFLKLIDKVGLYRKDFVIMNLSCYDVITMKTHHLLTLWQKGSLNWLTSKLGPSHGISSHFQGLTLFLYEKGLFNPKTLFAPIWKSIGTHWVAPHMFALPFLFIMKKLDLCNFRIAKVSLLVEVKIWILLKVDWRNLTMRW